MRLADVVVDADDPFPGVLVGLFAGDIGLIDLNDLVLCPPMPPGTTPSRIGSRMRCVRNQAVLQVTPSILCS